jgi:hypothetical protein
MKNLFLGRVLVVAVAVLPAAVAAASGGSGGGGGAAVKFAGVSISVSNETAPAGGMAQLKLFLTEPKPISTGGGHLTFGVFDSIAGIAVFSPANDTTGIALVRGSSIGLSLVSSGSGLGTTLDYPILTIVGRVPANASLGTAYPLGIDSSSLAFYDLSGSLYPIEVKAGHLAVGTGLSIDNVNPGSAIVPIGGIVTITGHNFTPKTTIRFGDAKIAQIRYVSSTRIDVVLAQTASMHGMMIKGGNPDGSSQTYFSYQRTRPMSQGSDPVMQFAMPLLPPTEVNTAIVPLPAPTASTTYGIAVQNIGNSDATATVELLDGSDNPIASATLLISPSRYIVREVSELFGVVSLPAAAIRVTSNVPVQVTGVAADQDKGTAMPILPR